MILENEFEKFTLYVGNLDLSVEENELHEIFNEITHDVSSVKICRNRNDGSSLGYAYINFNHSSKAESAMKELNCNNLKGKSMRIMFSERDPSKRRSGRGNVFIKNLHESIDDKQLSDMFSLFGKVLSSKVVCDAFGVSKGYGFVQFYSELSVNIACNARNQHIQVCPFVSRRQWDESPVFTNVYVKNLAKTATDADLKMIFGEFGEITSAVVMRDIKGKSRKFGFVNFERTEAAINAIEKMNGTIVDEKELYVGRAQRKKNRVDDLIAKFKVEKTRQDERTRKGLNLYVKNLEGSVNNKMLQELFSEFGTITSCKVMVHSNKMSKGVGFVEFSTSEEASKAMLKMNGKMVGEKRMYVSLAQCKEDRLHLQTQSNNMSQNVVSSTPTPSLHQHHSLSRAAAPASMLPPQPPFGGYSFQPHLMFGTRFPNGCPAIPIPNFMVPQSFPPALYPPAPPVSFHCGLQPMMSLPPLLPQPWTHHRI